MDKGAGRREVSWEPVEQQDSKGKTQGDCVPLYNRKGEKALKMQDETGIIQLKINLLVRAAPERGCLTIHVKYCKLIVVIRSGLHIYCAVRYKNYRKMSMGFVSFR